MGVPDSVRSGARMPVGCAPRAISGMPPCGFGRVRGGALGIDRACIPTRTPIGVIRPAERPATSFRVEKGSERHDRAAGQGGRMTSIAATPFAFDFDVATTALVIIDMQRDFVEPGGFGASLGNDVTRAAGHHSHRAPRARRVARARRPRRPHARVAPARPVRLPAGQAPARLAHAAHRRPRPDGPRAGRAASPATRSCPSWRRSTARS